MSMSKYLGYVIVNLLREKKCSWVWCHGSIILATETMNPGQLELQRIQASLDNFVKLCLKIEKSQTWPGTWPSDRILSQHMPGTRFYPQYHGG